MSELVIGASSQIALAYIRQGLAQQGNDDCIVAISRRRAPDEFTDFMHRGQLHWIQCDYSENSIKGCVETLGAQVGLLSTIVIANGILHDGSLQPEKRVQDLNSAHWQRVMHINAWLPMMWLQHLVPALHRHQAITIALFSARVGSITDNGLGGWYSYRASKAALNMMAKSLAIELSRRTPNAGILLFHPGTTDTPLSQPFQDNVASGKLFTPDFVAKALRARLKQSETQRPIAYLDWQGLSIPW